jgi:hypothetical protein
MPQIGKIREQAMSEAEAALDKMAQQVPKLLREGPVACVILYAIVRFRDDETIEVFGPSSDPLDDLSWEPILRAVYSEGDSKQDDLEKEFDALSSLVSQAHDRMDEIFWAMADDKKEEEAEKTVS